MNSRVLTLSCFSIFSFTTCGCSCVNCSLQPVQGVFPLPCRVTFSAGDHSNEVVWEKGGSAALQVREGSHQGVLSPAAVGPSHIFPPDIPSHALHLNMKHQTGFILRTKGSLIFSSNAYEMTNELFVSLHKAEIITWGYLAIHSMCISFKITWMYFYLNLSI